MFQGRFIHNIDTKGRVSIPAKFREIIAERYENKLILTNDFDRCIVAYPPDEWEMIIEKIKALPMKKEVKIFRDILSLLPWRASLTGRAEYLYHQRLRNHAGLNKEVCLVGIGNKIEIWDRKEWEKAIMLEDKDRVMEVLAELGV